jgi:hypothetical protein
MLIYRQLCSLNGESKTFRIYCTGGQRSNYYDYEIEGFTGERNLSLFPTKRTDKTSSQYATYFCYSWLEFTPFNRWDGVTVLVLLTKNKKYDLCGDLLFQLLVFASRTG